MGNIGVKDRFFKKKIKEFVFITLGVAISAFSFSFFLNPNDIVIGGVSGISIILKVLYEGFDSAWVILIINILLLFLGLILLGTDFFLKTAYGSITFPLFIMLFDWLYKSLGVNFSLSELDMVLIILFSSIIMGFGIGIVMKYGGTTGGTDVLQRVAFKYLHIPFSTSLYFIDGAVLFAGLLTGVSSIEYFLYAIIFTYLSGLVIDTVVFSGFNRRAVFIISQDNEAIKKEILEGFERGVTSIKVIGEYSKSNREMLVCVLSSNEYFRLRDIIEKIDPKAFYFVVRASEVRGEGFSFYA